VRYALSPYIKQKRFVFKGLIVTPEVGTIHAETCSVYLLIFEYTLKIDVVLYGFLKFLLFKRHCTTGWPTLKLNQYLSQHN
jgi:hypothetical protein